MVWQGCMATAAEARTRELRAIPAARTGGRGQRRPEAVGARRAEARVRAVDPAAALRAE